MKVVNNNNKHGLMPHLHQNTKCQARPKASAHGSWCNIRYELQSHVFILCLKFLTKLSILFQWEKFSKSG